MFTLRDPYRAPIARPRAAAVVRVSGDDLGDFYRDDNGHLWRYELKAAFPYGAIRAVTDAYGGSQTEWFDRPMLPSHDHDEVNSRIEVKAAILGVAEEAGEAVEEGGDYEGGTTPKKKPSSLPGIIAKSETPKSPLAARAPTIATSTLFIFLGMIGAGLIAWKYLA